MQQNRYDINQLIAHRAPMALLSRLVEYDKQQAIGEVTLNAQSTFMTEQGVASYVGIEYIAQAIAALAGANALDAGQEVDIGFLLGTRKYQAQCAHFQAGKTLRIHVTQVHQDESGLALFDGQILCGGDTVAAAQIKVFQPKDATQFISASDM
ncbi:ApeP family dehydratase [Pseudoalteromonas luteoviolacea]|uniref:3-hydroxylacyl-ACP dehydratase n=1 Tax=Pseudoalteromonas luteoviolacea H33 TaxID=1365251 RepID=A0A161Y2W7_9GAMM|nr:hypothetical protein [Pseudoalteromonas luteoviolacea]KZN50435.1 hypothetical protein N476_16455 [Pseudoalteromonas luteoviolacea H33]KZN77916.1 hypothetical protein N477_11010 [Pseudoalteromonas luteoviolacea H33-S]